MDLREFVSQALEQIVDGVVDAQKAVSPKGATVNAAGLYAHTNVVSAGDRTYQGRAHVPTIIVEFEVSVVANDGGGAKASLSVVTGVVNAKLGAGMKESGGESGKVKFAIPIVMPDSDRHQ